MQRCPYCFSKNLKVQDYRLASENELKYGDYYFKLKCSNCGGISESITVMYIDEPLRLRKLGDERSETYTKELKE